MPSEEKGRKLYKVGIYQEPFLGTVYIFPLSHSKIHFAHEKIKVQVKHMS